MRKKPLILLVLVVAIIIGIAVIDTLYGHGHTVKSITCRGTVKYREIVFSPLTSILS